MKDELKRHERNLLKIFAKFVIMVISYSGFMVATYWANPYFVIASVPIALYLMNESVEIIAVEYNAVA